MSVPVARRYILLMVCGFVPLLLSFTVNLWSRPQYQFFPLALAGAALLGWSRQKGASRPFTAGHPAATAFLMVGCFGILAVAILLWSPWLGGIAALVGIVGVAFWIGGWKLLRAMLPAMIVAATIIPPPLGLDNRLTTHLRGIAVNWSSRMLDGLGVIHSLSGNVIELPHQKLLVEEACSGINSVLLTAAACLFYLFWRRRSMVCFLICLPATLAFVLLGNVVRITLGAWLRFNYNIDILSGWHHELLGLVLLAFYLGSIVSLEHLLYWPQLSKGEQPTGLPAAPAAEKTSFNPAGIASHWGRAAAFVFALLGVLELGRGWMYYHAQHVIIAKSALREGTTFTLPERLGDWRRITSEVPMLHKIETAGICSQVWNYQNGSTVASVAFDYPFWGYHDVTVCYVANGWTVTRRQRVAEDADGNPPLMEVEMQKDPIGCGTVWFSTIDEHGRWMEAPLVKRGLIDRWKLPGGSETSTYRVQVLVAGYVPLTATDGESALKLFEEARKRLSEQLLGQIQVSHGKS